MGTSGKSDAAELNIMTDEMCGHKFNAFSFFIKSCEFFLDFLVHEYSFSKSEPEIVPPECWIEYRKGDVVLDVIYEYSDFPWIRVTVKGEGNSLDAIIKKSWHGQPINRRKGPSEPDARVDFALEKYSDILKQHITELM